MASNILLHNLMFLSTIFVTEPKKEPIPVLTDKKGKWEYLVKKKSIVSLQTCAQANWTAYVSIWMSNSYLKDNFVSSRTEKMASSFHCCRDGRVCCPLYHSISGCICKGTKQNREAKNRYPWPRYNLNLWVHFVFLICRS